MWKARREKRREVGTGRQQPCWVPWSRGMWVRVSWVPPVEAVSVTNKPRCRSPGRERGEHGGETAFCRDLHRGHRQELAAVTAWQGGLSRMWGAGHGQRCTEGDGPSQGRLQLGPTCQRPVAYQEGVGVWGSSGPQGQQQGVQRSTEMRASSPRDRRLRKGSEQGLEGGLATHRWPGPQNRSWQDGPSRGSGAPVGVSGALPELEESCPGERAARRQADLGPVLS